MVADTNNKRLGIISEMFPEEIDTAYICCILLHADANAEIRRFLQPKL